MKKVLIALFVSGLMCISAKAKSTTPGNLLISSDNQIFEYTIDGFFVQSLYTEYPGGYPSTEYARDIAADVDGYIYVYNGTFNPYMSSYDSASDLWDHFTYAGFSTANNASYGGIDVYGATVFATDMYTYSGGEGKGLVAFDLSTGEALRFAENIDPIDLTIGLDGMLYALSPGGSPGGRVISIYDPVTFESVGSIDLTEIFGWTEHRSLAVDSSGDIFIADWDGEIHHVSKDGVLIDTISPSCHWIGSDIHCEFDDIDISEYGEIALGTRFGEIVTTDVSFSHTAVFEVGSSNAFVEFVHTAPVPSNMLPTASFETDCTDLACSFTDTSSDTDGTISSWMWEFGDGQISTEQHPAHMYPTVGNYSVTLTVTDNKGASGTVSKPVAATDRVHVADIVLTRSGSFRRYKNAQAWVTVLDSAGSPVSGATVSGTFTGGVSVMISAVTGSDGTALLEAGPVRSRTHFSFCVDDVALEGYIYDAAADLESCDTIK